MTPIHLPQPYQEVDHTADLGVVVEGSSAEETLARLVLAMTQVLTGGGNIQGEDWVSVEVEMGSHVDMAVDLLRELLYRFDCEGWLANACEVRRMDPFLGVEVRLQRFEYLPDAHPEGVELKAVTLHEASFEQEGDRWRSQVLFDV